MYKKTVRILNDIFLFACILCIYFVWIQYFWRNFWQTILLVIPVTIFTFWIIKVVSGKKSERKEQTLEDEKKAGEASQQFLLAPKKEVLSFFKQVLNQQYGEVKETTKGLEIKTNEKKTLFVPTYNTLHLSDRDILPLLQNKSYKTITLCKSYSDEAGDLAKVFSERIELWDESKVYNKLLKPNETYPKLVEVEQKKIKRDYRKIIFARQKAKPYFLSGLVILFASFFVRFNIYYVVISSLLFFTSMYCLLYRKREEI